MSSEDIAEKHALPWRKTPRRNMGSDSNLLFPRINSRNGDRFDFPGYPPDKQEKATQTVLEQAQLLALGTEKGREPWIRAKQVRCSA